MIINYLEMNISQEKIICSCQNLLTQDDTTVSELSRVIGKMSVSSMAILSANLHFRFLQRQRGGSTTCNITNPIESGINNTVQCLNEGMGSTLSGLLHRRLVVSGGKLSTHKCVELKAALLGL